MASHEAQTYTAEYCAQIGRIAYSLAIRARAGEPVESLVRDARLMYRGAWQQERQRTHHCG